MTDPAQCSEDTLKKCCDHCDKILDDEYIEAWKKKKEKEEAERKKKEKKGSNKRYKEFYDD